MPSLSEGTIDRVHIVDADCRRRARVAREFNSHSVHAEIYESLKEFRGHPPRKGCVFVADDTTSESGLEKVVDVLASAGSALPIVVYAHEPTPERIVSAMLAGALDYLEWPFNPLLLDAAFRRLAIEGSRRAKLARLRVQAKASVQALSPREREVLALLADGMSNLEMGRTLGISSRTVEIHRAKMMRKLNAASTADAVRIALYAELDVEPVPLH